MFDHDPDRACQKSKRTEATFQQVSHGCTRAKDGNYNQRIKARHKLGGVVLGNIGAARPSPLFDPVLESFRAGAAEDNQVFGFWACFGVESITD